MDLPVLTRGLLLSIILGLIFCAWIQPATTGGLLLLMTVSSIVIYLALVIFHFVWLQMKGNQTPAPTAESSTGSLPYFISHRKKPISDKDESGEVE